MTARVASDRSEYSKASIASRGSQTRSCLVVTRNHADRERSFIPSAAVTSRVSVMPDAGPGVGTLPGIRLPTKFPFTQGPSERGARGSRTPLRRNRTQPSAHDPCSQPVRIAHPR